MLCTEVRLARFLKLKIRPPSSVTSVARRPNRFSVHLLKMKLPRPSIIEWCVLIFIAATLLGLLLPAIRAARETSSHGNPIPTVPPNEDRRLFHESGVSLVSPPDWWEPTWYGDRAARRLQISGGGGRYPSSIIVERLLEQPDLDGYPLKWRFGKTTFPARKTVLGEGQWLAEDRLFEFAAVVRIPDADYWIAYRSHAQIVELPEMVNLYLQTIRLPGRNGVDAANHPMQPSGEVGRLEVDDHLSPPADR